MIRIPGLGAPIPSSEIDLSADLVLLYQSSTDRAVSAYAGALASSGAQYAPAAGEADQGVTAVGTGVTIYDAVQALGANPGTIALLSQNRAGQTTYTLGTNLTIPKNITLKIENGALLSVSAGVTLTINGDLQAGAYQIFVATGTITGAPLVKEVLPRWFGAALDGTTNDATAMQAAVDLAGNISGCVVRIDSPAIRCNSTITVSQSDTVIEGQNTLWTAGISNSDTASFVPALNFQGASYAGLTYVGCRGITFAKSSIGWSSGADTDTVGVQVVNCRYSLFEFGASSFYAGMRMVGYDDGSVHNTVRIMHINNCRYGLYLVDISDSGTGWVNSNYFYGGRIGYSSSVVETANAAAIAMNNIQLSAGSYANNNNVFAAISLESASGASGYSANSALITCNGQQNDFIGMRFEQSGTAAIQQLVKYGAAARDNRIYGGRAPLGLTDHFSNYINDTNATTTTNRLIGFDRRGARARLNATFAVPDATLTYIEFDEVAHDTEAFWSAGSPDRLVIPVGSGIKRIKLTAYISLAGASDAYLTVYQNTTALQTVDTPDGRRLALTTGWITVAESDYFRARVYQDSAGSVNAEVGSYLELEVE